MLTGPKGAVFGSTSYWFLKLCSSLYYYRLQYLYLGDAAIFPKVDGDYFIFLAEDFRFGVFGHPWEQTMCIFGQELIEAVKACKVMTFAKLIRENGIALR